MVNAYTITFAGFLTLGGRAADLIGRRRMFLDGTALFSIASLLCAFASSRGAADRGARCRGLAAPRSRRELCDHHDLVLSKLSATERSECGARWRVGRRLGALLGNS